MIIGIDIDETISRCPEFFALVTKALKAEGHTILIITLRDDVDGCHRDLERWDIAYTELITIEGEVPPQNFVKWKAGVCEERGVNILFEDMPDVAAAVEPPTVVMMPLGDHTRRHMASIPWSEEE